MSGFPRVLAIVMFLFSQYLYNSPKAEAGPGSRLREPALERASVLEPVIKGALSLEEKEAFAQKWGLEFRPEDSGKKPALTSGSSASAPRSRAVKSRIATSGIARSESRWGKAVPTSLLFEPIFSSSDDPVTESVKSGQE